MKKIFLIFFLFFFSTLSFQKLFPNEITLPPFCSNNEIKTASFENESIESIDIEMQNIRKWSKNSLRILIGNFRWIPDKYKKRFKANVIASYTNGNKCKLKALIRHHGDQKDHIELKTNSFSQSIDVHLKTGNIQGITKFKLLRSQTRGKFQDEIFLNEILRAMNYLAPRTKIIETKINGYKSKMIFQEKIAKELLEYNSRREGPLLEGDERFVFRLGEKVPDNQISNFSVGMIPLVEKGINSMLTKMLNSQFVNKSVNHKKLSLNAIKNLNQIYLLYTNNYKNLKNNYYYFDYDLDNNLLGFEDDNKILLLDTYNLLIQSVNGQHGLAPSNRKFYWNGIENYFEPITYDSNINLSIKPNFLRLPLSDQFEKSFINAINKLESIDADDIEEKMKKNGVFMKKKEINEKLNIITANIKILQNIYENMDKDLIKDNQNKMPDESLWVNFYKSLQETAPNTHIVKSIDINGNSKTFEKCNLFTLTCENLNLDNNQINDLYEGSLIIDKEEYQYVGDKLYNENLISENLYKKSNIGNSSFFYNKEITIDYLLDKKILNITQNKVGARAYFLNGYLDDLEINFIGLKNDVETIPNFPIDIKTLTGCLSFINLELKNVNVNSSNSSCEDSLNFINTTGHIKNINIVSSYMDALDIDFSNIAIDNVAIENAKNDCVDLSYGNYNIKNIDVNNCGDKGLSVGEKSNLNVEKYISNRSSIGIAIKDSSKTNIKTANLNESEVCLSAYNKKQEFEGSILKIENLNCENFIKKINVDAYSKILIDNKNL